MKKITLLLILPFSLFASHLGKRGAEVAFGEQPVKRQELTECPFGVTKIIFATSGESAGTLPEEMTDQASIKRLCEISEVIGTACRFAQSQKNNEIEISDFPKHLFETLLEIDRNTNKVESILQSKDYDATNVSELLFLCYYFKVNSEAVKAIATYIANHENLFLAYLEFIRDLPNQDLFEYLINNLNMNDLERSDVLLIEKIFKNQGLFFDSVISPDGKYYIFINRNINNELIIIDLNNLDVRSVSGNFQLGLVVTRDSKYVIAHDGLKLYIIDLNNLDDVRSVPGDFRSPLTVTPDNKYLIANNGKNLDIINFNDLNTVGQFPGCFRSLLTVTPDSRYLINIDYSKNQNLVIIDLSNLKEVGSFLGDFSTSSVLVTSDSRYAFAANYNNLLIIDLNNLNNVNYIPFKAGNLLLTHDNNYLIATDINNKNLTIINLHNLNDIRYIDGDFSSGDRIILAVTPDSKYLIGYNKDNGILFKIDLSNLKVNILAKHPGFDNIFLLQNDGIIFKSMVHINICKRWPKFLEFIKDNYKNSQIFNSKLINEILKTSENYKNLFNRKLIKDINKHYNLT